MSDNNSTSNSTSNSNSNSNINKSMCVVFVCNSEFINKFYDISHQF